MSFKDDLHQELERELEKCSIDYPWSDTERAFYGAGYGNGALWAARWWAERYKYLSRRHPDGIAACMIVGYRKQRAAQREMDAAAKEILEGGK